MIENIASFFANETVKTVLIPILAASFASFFTYFFAIKKMIIERRNSIDDSLIARRMDVYGQAEELVKQLYQLEIIPCYMKNCKVIEQKLNKRIGQSALLYIHMIYRDVEQIQEFDKNVMDVLSKSIYTDKVLSKWLIFLHMYNENMILVYRSKKHKLYKDFSKIKVFNKNTEQRLFYTVFYKYLGLLGYYDSAVIGFKITKAIRKFYSSSNKTKFHSGNFIANYFHGKHLIFYSRKLNMRKYCSDEKNIVFKIMITCLECNEDCILAGNIKKLGEKAIEQENNV